jgi:hypothetical protein
VKNIHTASMVVSTLNFPLGNAHRQDSLVWSAVVGYKGARRQVTYGQDHLVGRPRWDPSGSGSICSVKDH